MNAREVKELIRQEKLVPILRTNTAEPILDLAKAVVEAGGKIIEYTTTIKGIISEIGKVKDHYPDLVIGLGTVYNKEEALEAIRNGVDFINTPILNYNIVDTVKSQDKLLLLSGFTPTEIYNAHIAGADMVKLFPASEMSPTFIGELKGPMPFVDIFPTGGLDLISAIQFLAHGSFAVGMGSTLFKKSLIENKNYNEITRLVENVIRRLKNMAI